MAKHRTFNSDKFLDKFQNNEQLLRQFVGLWQGRVDLMPTTLDVPRFKQWLVDGEGDAKDELLESLYQVYDLCTERGHEDLVAAADTDPNYTPDPEHELPVECLSLKVRTERDDLFNLAFDRYTLWRAERFTIYRGPEPRRIENLTRATRDFEQQLAEEFKNHKNSDRVLVRCYEEGPYVNFIVYHEKRTRATLIFKGTRTRPKIKPTIYRPAQQDFISYNRQTGQVEIEAGYENEEAKLRKCFALNCIGDAEFFEGDESANRITLQHLADPDFEFTMPEGVNVALVELKFSLVQRNGPRFHVNSRDVFGTLDLNGLRRKLDGGRIHRAVLKITFPDDQRGKRVELSGPNRIKFKRATHAEHVFRLLRDWGLLLDEYEDASELCPVSVAFGGSSHTVASGDGDVSAQGAHGARKTPRPR